MEEEIPLALVAKERSLSDKIIETLFVMISSMFLGLSFPFSLFFCLKVGFIDESFQYKFTENTTSNLVCELLRKASCNAIGPFERSAGTWNRLSLAFY